MDSEQIGRPPETLSKGEVRKPKAPVVGLVLALRERCRGLPPEAQRNSLRVADPNWRTRGSARKRSPRRGGTNDGCRGLSGKSSGC